MLQSKLFYKTDKNKTAGGEAASHELLARAGFVDQLMAGVYTFLPLGRRVLEKIEGIIRKNMESEPVNGQEILMPSLNPKENWGKTGRWDSLDILFKLKGAGDKEYALAPTHEEVVSPLARKVIFSYRDLPLYLFQIQNKFRNELRAKSGILRTREFLMKDLYSFHATQEDLDKYYDKMAKVYLNIFKECGIGGQTYRTFASGGTFSKYSDEFQAITSAGEDTIYVCKKCKLGINKEIKEETPACPQCGQDFSAAGPASGWEEKKSVEVGNIFKMGTKYSAPFDLKFRGKDGKENLVIMGCYGIGLSRLMGAIVEVCHDEKGIVWPKSVAPFQAHLIYLENDRKIKAEADKIYNDLISQGIEILYDDRQDKTAGEKFSDADLIGIPLRAVASRKTLEKKSVEVKMRNSAKIGLVSARSLPKNVLNMYAESGKQKRKKST